MALQRARRTIVWLLTFTGREKTENGKVRGRRGEKPFHSCPTRYETLHGQGAREAMEGIQGHRLSITVQRSKKAVSCNYLHTASASGTAVAFGRTSFIHSFIAASLLSFF